MLITTDPTALPNTPEHYEFSNISVPVLPLPQISPPNDPDITLTIEEALTARDVSCYCVIKTQGHFPKSFRANLLRTSIRSVKLTGTFLPPVYVAIWSRRSKENSKMNLDMCREKLLQKPVDSLKQKIFEDVLLLGKAGVLHRELQPRNIILFNANAVTFVDFDAASTAKRHYS